MKILQVISSIDVRGGGPSRSVTSLCSGIARKGISIQLLAKRTEQPYINKSEEDNFYLNLVSNGRLKKNLKTTLNKDKIDLLHGHGIWQLPVHHMSELARRKAIPYVISPRGMLEPWALNAGKFKKKLALWFYQYYDIERAACIHATADMEALNIRNLGLKNPIAVIPNGINLSDYSVSRSNRADEDHHILFLSRLHPKKGIELLIQAWSKLSPDQRKGWKITIVGNGDSSYISMLNQLISSKRLKDDITILGPLFGEEKIKSYQEADLFVLPTYSENFGIVVVEALACGIPVITTKGTPWEELDSHQAGWWIDIGVEPLVKALTEAIALPESERQVMGQNGRELVKRKYSIEAVSDKMVTLYNWILNGGERPEFVYLNSRK